ncbi:purine-nucleoside phosphorylase [Vreelandella utahensis]|uniref:purine-nucleoside phosphorylase n=1 Tax=Vreelandella halophila TaxID=86177 RepID=UPI000985EFDA|nr:purine nucleoside permease [Halomonas utahensis]
MIRTRFSPLLAAGLISVSTQGIAATEIKAVVVTHFENGDINGEESGEYHRWVQRLDLEPVDFPLGQFDLHLNDEGILAICTGGGVTNATASIMALGLDERFDLSDAYWLVSGIGGGDPEDVSLGTGVWARHVVDGDLLYEIDAREMPEDWAYGLIPLGAEEPNQEATGWTVDTISFDLNGSLAEWAYDLTRGHAVGDTPAMKDFRAMYENYPEARKPPSVALGDTLSASTYWHGDYLNDWANDWVKLQAGDDANMVTSNMEDSGTLTALHRLAREDLVDPERVMVLRTVSNYTFPPDDKTAAWSTTAPYPDNGEPAYEAAFQLGNRVVQTLVDDWDRYQTNVPGTD